MSQLQQDLRLLAELTQLYQEQAAPLINRLRPYVEAARKAEALGIGPNATADQIIDAFAGSVRVDPPMPADFPSVLSAAAPQEIRKAGDQMIGGVLAIGKAVGSLLGIIAGMR